MNKLVLLTICSALLITLAISQAPAASETNQMILSRLMTLPAKEMFKAYHLIFKKQYDLETEKGIKSYKNFVTNLELFKKNKEANPTLKFDDKMDQCPLAYRNKFQAKFQQQGVNLGTIRIDGMCIFGPTYDDFDGVGFGNCDFDPANDAETLLLWRITPDSATQANIFIHNKTGKYLVADPATGNMMLSESRTNIISMVGQDGPLMYGQGSCVRFYKDEDYNRFFLFDADCSRNDLVKNFHFAYRYPFQVGNIKYNGKCLTSVGSNLISFASCNGSVQQSFTFRATGVDNGYGYDLLNLVNFNGQWLSLDTNSGRMSFAAPNSPTLMQNLHPVPSDDNDFGGYIPFVILDDLSFWGCVDSTTFPLVKNGNCDETNKNQRGSFTACAWGFNC